MKPIASLKKITVEVICYLYILLFVYAAVSKLLDFENFKIQLGQSPVLSVYANYLSWVVPIFELILAILLALPIFRSYALTAAYFLMILFTVYIVIILYYSPFVPCSCGGVLEKLSWNDHVIFNGVYILLALIALFLSIGDKKPYLNAIVRFFTRYSILMVVAILIMVGLYSFSENTIHYHNTFIRRFTHKTTEDDRYDFRYNSFYYAGSNKDAMYFGNYTAPRLVTSLDYNFKNKNEHLITPDSILKSFHAPRLQVYDNLLYLIDGSIPVIYKGNTKAWKASLAWSGSTFFTRAVAFGNDQFGFTSIRPDTGELELGTLKLNTEESENFNVTLLQKQVDGVFDADGTLQFDKNTGFLTYLYRYRNEFIVMNPNLELLSRGKTIDTVSTAAINVVYLEKHKQKKISGLPKEVNKGSTVSKNLLFVNSGLPGQFESLDMWKSASIIDVYDLSTNSYILSFYIYHIGKETLKNFFINDNQFYGFIGNYLVRYNLDKQVTSRFNNN
jgi:uncharacterized membrane protein YphA (DoxX/SURF4 family)